MNQESSIILNSHFCPKNNDNDHQKLQKAKPDEFLPEPSSAFFLKEDFPKFFFKFPTKPKFFFFLSLLRLSTNSSKFLHYLTLTDQKLKFLIPMIYNPDTVLSNTTLPSKEQDEFEKQVSLYDKLHGFGAEIPMNLSILLSDPVNTLQSKIFKQYKWTISKVISSHNKHLLLIYDCYLSDSLQINLETLIDPPCKSLAFDSVDNYIFLFDNRESIYVLTGKIEEKWASVTTMSNRTIGVMKLNQPRKNPILYCFHTINGPILLVIGGYSEVKKNMMVPLQDILVFSCDFTDFNNMPNLKIRLRYPRAEPLVFHLKYEEKNEGVYDENIFSRRLYIVGGINEGILKKLKLSQNEKKELMEANFFCETINLEEIEGQLIKLRVMKQNNINNSLSDGDLPEILTNKTFELLGDEIFMKRIETLARGAIVKYMKKSENKCILFVGLGKKKQKLYELSHIDEKGQRIFMLLKGKLAVENRFIGNHMVCMKNNVMCYLGDKNDDHSYYKLDMIYFEKSNSQCKVNCAIF